MIENNRILLVDDDREQAEMVREYLRLSGFPSVDHVVSLKELWERLQRQPYDLILLDYMLSDGTGLDALKEIARRNIDLPVVMVTGQGDERIAATAIQHGAVDYIVKTSDYLNHLPAVVRKGLHSHRLQLSVQRSLSQVRYQALLLNNVRDAIVVWDVDGRITYWNPSASALFGWTPQERLGKQVEDVYLSEFTPPMRLPAPGDTVGRHVERKVRTRDEREIWVSSRITVLRDSNGGNTFIGYMDVLHDITQRKQAEQALREERNFASAVLDTVGALILVLDSAGRIVRFNRACEQVTGYSLREVEGRVAEKFLKPPGQEPTFSTFFRRLIKGELPMQEESLLLTRTGEHRVISWSITALQDGQGKLAYVIATGHDITDRKEMEVAIRIAQTQLTQAARMATIGELASGVAHQINNPLTTIIADAQILLRNLPEEPTAVRESAEAIEQAGWRLQEAVQRLLEFSRPGPELLTNVDIAETLQHALLLVGAHIESAGIVLELKLDAPLPAVRGNSRQLEDLWVNLLLLARDAAVPSKDAYIRMETHRAEAGGIIVEVRDNGIPIPLEEMETIFEPNFVGPSSGRGTGMELSICREIVRQHSGEIVAEITHEHDTIFRVSLPAAGSNATEHGK